MHPESARAGTAERSQQAVAHARSVVLAGRGPGASAAEVFAQGRGKLVQAGMPVVQRLAETARDAAHARAAGATFVDGGLIADLGHPSDANLAELIGGSQIRGASPTRGRSARVSRGAVLVGSLLIIVLLRRSGVHRSSARSGLAGEVAR